jgi:uncharacterized protein (TIGR02001 family)
MKMKRIALACGVALLGMSVQSMAEVSMNVGVTSNYIWRGVSQTDDAAAVSGGLDWSGASGLYAGTWVSNVDFGACCETSYELDLYGGFANQVGDFGYDLGLIYYTYDDANFLELALSGSWQFLSAGLNYTLSSDVEDTAAAETFIEGDLYYYAGVSFDLPEDFSAGLTIGSYSFEDDGVNNADFDYTHYQADLTKSAGDFGDVTLSLSDTDLDDDDMKFLVSWSKSF